MIPMNIPAHPIIRITGTPKSISRINLVEYALSACGVGRPKGRNTNKSRSLMQNNIPINIKGRTDISIKRFLIVEFLFIAKLNEKGEAAGIHPENEAELFTLASTRLLGSLHLIILKESI
jgi:hypothetical protein